MMNSILFYITAACLAVGANAVCPILNEYVPGSRQVEVFNNHAIPTSAPCYLDVFATEFQNLFCVAIPDLLPGQYYVIDLEIDFSIRTNEYLITVSSQPGLLRPTLDNFPLDLIFDTFYYRLPGSVAGYPFGGLVDEWSSQGNWANQPSISRCNNLDPRSPPAWEETAPATLGFANVCPDDIVGDPHFAQTVLDKNSKNMKKICYDVTGKSGQSIYIFNDKLCSVKVEGVLMDDYYMHEIRLTIEGKPMTISRHSIIYMGKRYEWTGSSILYLEGARLTVSRDDVVVQIYRNENVALTIKVKRSMNKYNVEHLDVFLGDLSQDTTRYGGLIGDIQQKEFSVSDSIQSDNLFEVVVDQKVTRARMERRDQMECILLSFSSLVGTENIDKYVY